MTKKNLIWPDYENCLANLPNSILNYFGQPTVGSTLRTMLGDYLAIAISDLSIYYNDERWVSMHGSVTEDEMLIPLIVLDKPKEDLT